MSWRAESTFKKTSALNDDEKEFLKISKKLREILKLEERQLNGEKLDKTQEQKVTGRAALLKEVTAVASKLPAETEVFDKNQDIAELLPNSSIEKIAKARAQEVERLEKRRVQEEREKDKPEFMIRHDRPILSVCVSPDVKYLFTCSKDKYVLCWKLDHRLLSVVTTFGGHQGAVWAVDVCPGPCGLVSGGADGKVLFWHADPAKLKKGTVASSAAKLDHGGIVRVLRWCPFAEGVKDGRRLLASASEKLGPKLPAIGIWSVSESGKAESVALIDDPKVLPTKANDLRWGSGGKLKLFSAHDNGYVGVWLAAEGSLMKVIKLSPSPISSLALTVDGATLLAASHDSTCSAVDISTRETPVIKVYKSNRPLNAVCVSSDYKADAAGLVVVAGGKDPRDVTRAKDMVEDEFEAKVLDSGSAEECAAGKGHFGPIHFCLALPTLGPKGAFATASEDGCVRVHGLDGTLLHSDTLQ